MSSPKKQLSAEELPERQRIFLERLRQHDRRVQVFRDGNRVSFHGPIIGDGPMPPDEPAMSNPNEES